jgi:hypothetical protein
MTVTAEDRGRKLGEVRMQFRVGKPNLEYERLDLDDRLLRRVADATGGRYCDLRLLGELVDSLSAEVRRGRQTREVRLYPDRASKSWALALVFLAAAAAEWIIRKRLQLS